MSAEAWGTNTKAIEKAITAMGKSRQPQKALIIEFPLRRVSYLRTPPPESSILVTNFPLAEYKGLPLTVLRNTATYFIFRAKAWSVSGGGWREPWEVRFSMVRLHPAYFSFPNPMEFLRSIFKLNSTVTLVLAATERKRAL
jgi:hypothetical protein